MRCKVWLATLILIMIVVIGCGPLNRWAEQRSIEETRVAEEYPYAVYPISEENKAKLCQALSLPPDSKLCQPGTEVMHWDVFETIEDEFPVDETSYSEVEAKLGTFPHIKNESTGLNGEIIALWYDYGLTEYEGACIFFEISLEDQNTIKRILSSSPGRSGSGWNSVTCGPFER